MTHQCVTSSDSPSAASRTLAMAPVFHRPTKLFTGRWRCIFGLWR